MQTTDTPEDGKRGAEEALKLLDVFQQAIDDIECPSDWLKGFLAVIGGYAGKMVGCEEASFIFAQVVSMLESRKNDDGFST